MDALGTIVRRARLAKGLLGWQLAAAIGKNASFVTKLEHGEVKEVPPPRVLHALAEALDLSEADLLVAIGYVVHDEPAPVPVDSDHAAVIAAVPRLTARQARLLRVVIQEFDLEEEERMLDDPGEAEAADRPSDPRLVGGYALGPAVRQSA